MTLTISTSQVAKINFLINLSKVKFKHLLYFWASGLETEYITCLNKEASIKIKKLIVPGSGGLFAVRTGRAFCSFSEKALFY